MALQKGDKVVVVGPKTFDHAFTEGQVVTYTGEEFPKHHRGQWYNFRSEDGDLTQYMLEDHYKPLEVKVSGEIAEKVVDKTLPAKALYAVIKANGKISYTGEDRDTAREVKAALGGKKKGVRIISYLAEKEIR